jgi:hypothetical protein
MKGSMRWTAVDDDGSYHVKGKTRKVGIWCEKDECGNLAPSPCVMISHCFILSKTTAIFSSSQKQQRTTKTTATSDWFS